MGNMLSFFNSSFFSALITLFVGLVAYLLYKKQKNDFKRDAASILVNEIRYAEANIEDIRNKNFEDFIKLSPILSNNNWEKYSYLFIKDFDSDELNLINNFYSSCKQLDIAINQLSLSKQLEQKTNAIQEKLAEIAYTAKDFNEYNTRRDNFINFVSTEGYTFPPAAPQQELLKAISNINAITTSSLGQKLKKIAQIN